MTDASTLRPEPCLYCGSRLHLAQQCPRVAGFEYYRDGRIKSVRFFPPIEPVESIKETSTRARQSSAANMQWPPGKPDD